jgi:hypothetical protein
VAKGSPRFYVPVSYVTPNDDPKWPEDLRGINLGSICIRLRHNVTFQSQKKQLQNLGFLYKVGSKKRTFKEICEAIEYYKHLVTPDIGKMRWSYRVPHNDVRWPKHLWGLELGIRLGRYRMGRLKSYEKRQKIIDLGVPMKPLKL